jgi:group I intron endonuclease
MIVYKIHNKLNGKIYIGLTTKPSVKMRFYEHVYSSKKQKRNAIQSAILKYGIENFDVDVIETCDSKGELIEREKYWIKHFNACDRNTGYNITNGGEGCRERYGYKLTKEHRGKLSIAKIGNKCHLGKPHSEETKMRISREKKGIISEYNKKISKKVLCIDTGIVYCSIEEAARENKAYPQNIRKVCRGERRTTNGLKYKYCDE